MKDLTDVDEFSGPIIVPEGLDSRSDAADVVEAALQRVANRTHYLNQRTAKLAAANTFAANQQINGSLGVTGNITADDITSSGDITILGDGDLHVGDDIDCGGELHVGSFIDAVGDIFAGDDLVAGDNIVAGTNVTAGGAYQYSAPRNRDTWLNVFAGFGQGAISFGGGINHVAFGSAGHVHVWPIKLPQAAHLTRLRARVAKADVDAMTMRLYRRDNNNAFTGLPTDVELAFDTEAASGQQTLEVSGDWQIDNGNYSYYVHISSGNANDGVYQLKIEWNEVAVSYLGG
jgi:hypothetical protein